MIVILKSKIQSKKEYSFKYTKQYGKHISRILELLKKEYPLAIEKIESTEGMGFIVTALIIHSINYSRQMFEVNSSNTDSKNKEVKDEN